jgi:mannobiose 2-epimerase
MAVDPEIKKLLEGYSNGVETELFSILDWWTHHINNPANCFYYGEINSKNEPDAEAPIGLVLQSRLLWTFSAAFKHTQNHQYLKAANQAYDALTQKFYDNKNGGMYWSVHPNGQVASDKKQAYGIAFAIYGLSAYYEVTLDAGALKKATDLYTSLEKHFFDSEFGGYIECLGNNWSEIDDVRLSDKDQNAIKSMNTHLHIIEAYAALYKVLPNAGIKQSIQKLLHYFEKFIIDVGTSQQNLFFEKNWTPTSSVISFGHDIEASWLLQEAAAIIDDDIYLQKFTKLATNMAGVVANNVSSEGAVYNEYHRSMNTLDFGKDWWPQAEAMVGFLNAYQNTGNIQFLQHSLKSWQVVNDYFKDSIYGEWHWGYDSSGNLMVREKAGFWKCPYHNSRACIEVANRIKHLLQSQ